MAKQVKNGERKTLWIVSHGTFLHLLFSAIMGVKNSTNLELCHNNVGISCFLLNNKGDVIIKFINRFVPQKQRDRKLEVKKFFSLDYIHETDLEDLNLKKPSKL